MVLFTHPTGNQNVRSAARGLADAGLLRAFYTTIATFEGDALSRLAALPGLGELNRRRYPEAIRDRTETAPGLEFLRLGAARLGLHSLTKRDVGYLSVDAVYRRLDRKVARAIERGREGGNLRAVYAYDGGAAACFAAARGAGLQRFFDLPTGYWRAARAIDEQERAANPAWASSLPGLDDTESKLRSKDDELACASHIFVASGFVAETLKRFPGPLPPVSVIPYGFPPVTQPKRRDDVITSRPLRVLFVGGLTQRKGISYLFDGTEALGHRIELTVVGRRAAGLVSPVLDRSLRNVNYIESLPHDRVLEQMRRHDVLVFPSLFEGFGLVISEAMSQGTPVVTTTSTAGVDLIENGVDGWVVRPGESEPITAALASVVDDRARLYDMSEAARRTAAARRWVNYERELAAEIGKLLPS